MQKNFKNENSVDIIDHLEIQQAERDAQLAEINNQLAEKTQQLSEIYQSKSWRLILFLRKIRILVIPVGSLFDRILSLGIRAAVYIKQNGMTAFAHRFFERLTTGERLTASNIPPAPFKIIIQDGDPCPFPAISIVVEKNSKLNLPLMHVTAVEEWALAQTLHRVEIVQWNSEEGTAKALSEPIRSWVAPDIEAVCRGLTGRYLCMASPDLLKRNQTYLETNLIALESEGLAFTVNALGRSDWQSGNWGNRHLPGKRTLLYLRQVIRKDCVRNDFSLDVTSCLSQRQDIPIVAGKIIVHTTAFPDTEASLPAETLLSETSEWSRKGNYILARSSSQIPWEPLEHVIHPVDTVIPISPEPSDLPTVIVFVPFLAVGGAERLVLQLINYLKVQVRFVVVTLDEMDAALGTTADFFHQAIPYVYTAADFLLSPLKFSLLKYLIERFQATTLYIANGSDFIYDSLSLLREYYPELRIVDQVYDHQFGWINRYDNTAVSSLDAHISANPNITRAYKERGVSSGKIHFVEHPVNLEDVNPADYPFERCLEIKKMLGIPLEKKIITFCARLHPQKRPFDFIELARRFSSEEKLHFLMVGDGLLGAAVEEQITRIGMKNLTRHKFYTPIADVYAVTDVMVLPSEYEAMPLVILETLAMGKPVVATDVGHIRDVVEMTHGGVVVSNIGDVTAIRSGVLLALKTKVDPVAMRQSIAKRFGVSYIAKKYLAVWLEKDHA